MGVAVGEDAFGDGRDAVGEAEHRHQLGLQIGREAGVGLGDHLDGLEPLRPRPRGAVPSAPVTVKPASSMRSTTAARWSRLQFRTANPPPAVAAVMAAAIRKVPASIRSGMMRCSTPVNFSTPSIRNSRRAVAGDLRPHLVQHRRAIADLRLTGRADEGRHALGQGGGGHNVDRPQHRRPHRPAEVHRAPPAAGRAGRGRRCCPPRRGSSPPASPARAGAKSIGRSPIAQPPGMLATTRPRFASSGPRTQMLARIVFTMSYRASTFASSTTSRSSGPLSGGPVRRSSGAGSRR